MAFPFGYTIFCDDIRHEIGGKITFVGVYRQTLIVHGSFPVTLPKFALAIHWVEKASEVPESIELKVYFPGDADDKPSIVGDLALSKVPREETEWSAKTPEEKRTNTYITFVVMAPLELKTTGSIKVRIKRHDQIIRIGRLRVQAGEPRSKNA